MHSVGNSLSSFEQEQLAACEQIIEKGLRTFFEVGQAFLRIREEKLYRTQYKTFAGYCRGRWKWSDSRARQYMRAVEVTVNLKDGENGTHVPIPTSEYQVRSLVSLAPEQQREAWRLATEKWPDPTKRQVDFAAYIVWRESISKANIEITSKQPESSSSPEELLPPSPPLTFEQRCELGWQRISPAIKSAMKGFEPQERQAVWEFLARKLTERTNYQLTRRDHVSGRTAALLEDVITGKAGKSKETS
jgi:hypothetical protein